MPSTARILPDSIQWHEGMLLVPQHFQQYDLRQQQISSFHLNHLTPFYWGVESLTFDESLLASGKCRLLSFRGVLPDGTLIDALPSSTPYLEADLAPFAKEFQSQPLNVYLCLPQLKGDVSDILGQLPRYRSTVGENVSDLNTGDSPVMIPRLEYKLELVVSASPPAQYIAMPIARIKYDGKTYVFDTYQCPILQVTPATLIWQICDQISAAIRSKLGYIQQKIQSIGQNSSLAGALHQLGAIRMQMLSALFVFEATQQVNVSHPFLLYSALCGIAGTVSGITHDSIPARFSPYNHADPISSFMEVITYIELVLKQIQESYSVISFVQNDRIFSLQLQSAWTSDQFAIGVQASSGMSDSDLIKWINNALIASESNVNAAREARVLGASRRIVEALPEIDLIPTQGIKLVVVDADPKFINFKETLQVFNVSDNASSRPLEVVLYRSQKKG